MRYDIVIVGAGIVGLASAWHIQKNHPGLKLLVIEKESGPAKHQSGHNSGVIHSGIYYTPGSLKARFARQANVSMPAFCAEHGIKYDLCGKVVVAVDQEELPRLDKLQARAAENQIPVRRLSGDELRAREPHCAGIAALEVPSAGIADYPGVCRKLVELITLNGGEVRWSCPLQQVKIASEVAQLMTPTGPIETKLFVTCGGLQSDLLAAMAGVQPPAHIVPFRGEYYTLKPESRRLVNHLIYPLPNPAFPFLGVHFTRMVNGEIHAGPNAVLAFRREGYHRTDISLLDMCKVLSYSGFRKMAKAHWREGMHEQYRSFSRRAFLQTLQRLIPEITDADIQPSPAGVRAMAVKPDGSMIDDFLIADGQFSMHVCNAPSPAATASLEIGKYVAERVSARL